MKRKLIGQGTSSLTVSLPNSWIKKFKLKKGDEIYLEEHEKSMIITTKEGFVAKKSKIDISGLKENFIWIYLADIYIRGDDEIEIRFASRKELSQIVEISNDLLGMTIVEQGKDSCIMKDVSGISDDSFDALLRRIFLLTISMAEDGAITLTKDPKAVNDISERDKQINRLTSFCLRMLNKKGHADYKKTAMYTTIIYLLEQIGDEYARCFRDIKEPVSKKPSALFDRVVMLNRNFYSFFYKFDQNLVSKMIEDRNSIREEVDLMLSKARSTDAVVLYRSKKIAELIVDVVKIEVGMHI